MRRDIRRYVATEALRRYGPVEPGLPQQLRAYIRRNRGVFVDRDDIASTLALYKEVYSEACALLPRFIRPSRGAYASDADVRLSDLVDALASRFPDEPRDLLEIAASYCVYYEYLR